MSWLFSQALVEACSVENFSGGEPSAPLSVMPTPHKFWHRDKTTEASSLSRYGLTCAVLTVDRGEALLMSYLADFRARTSARPAVKQALMVKNRGYGGIWRGLSTKFDLGTCSWRIHHSLFPTDLPESSVILPCWGSMRNGELWERSTPEWITTGNVYGLLPTPTATDYKGSTPHQVQRRHRKGNGLTLREWLAKYSQAEKTVYPNPGFLETVMGWPIGWTELSPLATDKFQQWLQQHSVRCVMSKKAA
jgi:hypothetical protein